MYFLLFFKLRILRSHNNLFNYAGYKHMSNITCCSYFKFIQDNFALHAIKPTMDQAS